MSIHSMASSGFGTGKGALYDKARPTYPVEALQAIRDNVRGKAPLNVLELGAGTGIFTRRILEHPSFHDAIGALRAVEPSDDFHGVLLKSTAGSDPRVTATPGTFNATGAPDGWADIVVVAQAWHWCPDHETAVAELARVLKPDGIACFIWNLEDRDTAHWVARLRDLFEKYEEGSPQFRLGLWRATFDAASYGKNFEKEQELTFPWAVETTKDGVVERVRSKSYIAVLPEDLKSKLTSDILQMLDEEPKSWVDEQQGVFNYPYKTTLVVMPKKVA